MTAPDERDVELVHGLVEIPSVSGQERAAVSWLVERMSERGFHAHVDAAGNAVGEIGSGAFHVALVGHIDTVPGQIAVRIEDGALVGRGAVDAKGPLCAFVAAASEPVAGVRVSVIGAVEEESPSSAGAQFLAKAPAPNWCVIGEPSGWDAITVGYKGRLLLRCSLVRDARHGAAPGATCAEEAVALWERIRAASPSTGAAGFASLDCRLEAIEARPNWPDGLRERADLLIGYRLPPGMSPAELASRVSSLLESEAESSVEVLSSTQPVQVPRSTPLARALVAAISGAGGSARFTVKSGTSDMNLLAQAWNCPIVAYGPGDARYDHTPIERLPLEDYGRAISVLRGMLRQAGKP